jgi:hypothetical protein
MKNKTIDLGPERALVTFLIVSDKFINRVAPILRPSQLKTGYAREIAAWALEYWEKYRAAPGRNIQDIYQHRKAEVTDDDDADNLGEFLRRLSEDWEKAGPTNIPHAVDEAVRYLKIRSLQVLRDDLEDALDNGDPLKAEQFVARFSRIEPPTGSAVSLLRDTQAVTSALMEEEERLFHFPGALGKLGGWFTRGDFISFLGPMKRGKTHWMWWTAELAAHNNLRAVYITLEMTAPQMIRRGWRALTGSPREAENVVIPYFEEVEDDKWVIKAKEDSRNPVDPADVENRQKKLRRMFRGGDIQVIAVPAFSATVQDIEAHLDNLNYYNKFVPDVILVDYADIVAPSGGGRGDYRHQLDEIWKRLRRMAQERNCLVVTASQSDRTTFGADVRQENISEDIRKLAHVTAMFGLNQSDAEYEKGVMRVSQTVVREGRRIVQQVVVLQSLAIGRPCSDSRWAHDVEMDEEEHKPAERKKRRR